MAQFKTKEELAKDGPELDVIFNVATIDGPCKVRQKGTGPMLEEILKRYNKEGLTIHTTKGFTWYPTNSIRKVDVETI